MTVFIIALQVAVPVLNSRGRSDVDLLAQLGSIVLFLASVAFRAVDHTTDILWGLVAAYGFRTLCLTATAGYLMASELQSLLLCIVPGGLTALLSLVINRIFLENIAQSFGAPARLALIMGIYVLILLLTWLTYRAFLFRQLGQSA